MADARPRRNVAKDVAHRRAVMAGRSRTGADYHLRKLADQAASLTSAQRQRLAELLASSLAGQAQEPGDDAA